MAFQLLKIFKTLENNYCKKDEKQKLHIFIWANPSRRLDCRAVKT